MIGVGARFSNNHTANWRKGSIYDLSQTKIVQVDLDYQEVGRNFPVELGLVSDAKLFLEDLAAAAGGPGNKKHQGWLERTQGFRAEWEEEIRPLQTATSAPTHPARLVHEVGRALPKDGRVYVDIGDVTQYAEAYMKICTPGAWQISPGMAEMGWASSGIPGAIVADGRPGIALVGDGAFNMTSQIVASAVEYDLPAIWVILNNYELESSARAWSGATRAAIRGVILCARIPASLTIPTTWRWPTPTARKAFASTIPLRWRLRSNGPLPAGVPG